MWPESQACDQVQGLVGGRIVDLHGHLVVQQQGFQCGYLACLLGVAGFRVLAELGVFLLDLFLLCGHGISRIRNLQSLVRLLELAYHAGD